jgi:hypothetical protein
LLVDPKYVSGPKIMKCFVSNIVWKYHVYVTNKKCLDVLHMKMTKKSKPSVEKPQSVFDFHTFCIGNRLFCKKNVIRNRISVPGVVKLPNILHYKHLWSLNDKLLISLYQNRSSQYISCLTVEKNNKLIEK